MHPLIASSRSPSKAFFQSRYFKNTNVGSAASATILPLYHHVIHVTHLKPSLNLPYAAASSTHDVVDALFAATAANLPRSCHILWPCTYAVSAEPLEPQEVVATSTDKERRIEEEYRFQPAAEWRCQAITAQGGTTEFEFAVESPVQQ
jgi:hypothetical protein